MTGAAGLVCDLWFNAGGKSPSGGFARLVVRVAHKLIHHLNLGLAKPDSVRFSGLMSLPQLHPAVIKFLSARGKAMRAVNSDAQKSASRLNGKLGGRPKKTVSQSIETVIPQSEKLAV